MTPVCPVAVVGMAALMPGANDLDAFWRNLRDGVDAITEVTPDRWDDRFYHPGSDRGPLRADRIYCRRGGFVTHRVELDVARFGIAPSSVTGTEPDQLIALKVGDAAITDAGGRDRLGDAERIGVILGRGGFFGAAGIRMSEQIRGATQVTKTLGELFPELDETGLRAVKEAYLASATGYDPANAIGLSSNLAASRLANRLDLRGPAYTIDAACASSLLAIDQAVGELARGRCDVVLAGGVHHVHDISFWSIFSQLRALSRDQQIRPFSRHADGTLIGEGTGVVVLKRLADAERDGDRIYAVVRGTGVASDGRTTSLFNPDAAAQARAITSAWRAAGLDPTAPDALGLLEAHGTATPAGDKAELASIAAVFGAARPGRPAVIGSVKSMIGHIMPAAGIAGFIKAALAIHHRTLLPTLHCEEPHPDLAATGFAPIAEAVPWEVSDGGTVRRAGVNAFGFGGINAHVVLEEPASRRTARIEVREPEKVLLLSAATPTTLRERLRADDASLLAAEPGETPAAGCRLGLVNPTSGRLSTARTVVARGQAWRGHQDIWFSPVPLFGPSSTAQLAFVFPGMEATFEPRIADVAARFGLSRLAERPTGLREWGIGIVNLGRILHQALAALGITPDCVAGSSVGEWAAMIAAGINSADGFDAYNATGASAAWTYPDAVFAVLNQPVRVVEELIGDRWDLEISHDNSPTQCIVCGAPDTVEEFVAALRGSDVVANVLPFRSGFHTRFFAPHLDPLLALAREMEVRPPSIPVWSAAAADRFPRDDAGIRRCYLRNLVQRVRFREMVNAMYADGVRGFVQLGTGRLATLVGEILADREHLAIAANVPHRSGLSQLLRVGTALWAEGRPMASSFPARLFDSPGKRRSSLTVPIDLSTPLVTLTPESRAEARRAFGNSGPSAPTAASNRAVALLRTELDELTREMERTFAVLDQVGKRRAAPRSLRVGVETMPYLLDHCFFRQRPDWPDLTDRLPVVPAATLVEFLREAAPGPAAVVREARFRRWVVAAPEVDIPITVTSEQAGTVRVGLGDYCGLLVEPGPAPGPAAPWPVDPAAERVPAITARQYYDHRVVFHGPLFQGITELTAIGETHIRGTITATSAPGSVLDAAGQLFGYWMECHYEPRNRLFPISIEEIQFHSGPIGAGTEVGCHIRVTEVTEDAAKADLQLSIQDKLCVEVRGWRSRRFDNSPHTAVVGKFPESRMLCTREAGGRLTVRDRWPDLATLDMVMRVYLGAAERTEYEAIPHRQRRTWLLGRIAAKDAVRTVLWDNGAGPVYPAEIRVIDDRPGRPRVVGMHGRELPPLDVAVAVEGEQATGIAREHRDDAEGTVESLLIAEKT